MDTTLFDLYGTLANAYKTMKAALRDERAWSNLDNGDKAAFCNWIEDNASAYKDGDTLDWVGAFYDWLED